MEAIKVTPYFRIGEAVKVPKGDGVEIEGYVEDIVTIPQLWVLDALENSNIPITTLSYIAEALLERCKVMYRIKNIRTEIILLVTNTETGEETEVPVDSSLFPQDSLKKIYEPGDSFKDIMHTLKGR